MKLFTALIKKELVMARRNLYTTLLPLLSVVLLAVIFPLAIGTEATLLRKVAGGIVWVSLLLCLLLACDQWLRDDVSDGTLVHWSLSGQPLWLMMLAKGLVLWLIHIVPLLCILPFLGFLYNLPLSTSAYIAVTILIGSPTLIVFAFLGSMLIVAIPRAGLLVVLLMFPLCFPIVIFAIKGISAFSMGFVAWGNLVLLLALLVFSLTVIPFAIMACLRLVLAES